MIKNMELYDLFLQKKHNFSITYEGCTLKPLSRKDLLLIRSWFRDMELSRQAFGIIAKDEVLDNVVRDYFRNVFATSMEVLGIWGEESNLLGFINYSVNSHPDMVGRFGIVIGDEKNRNKGLGTKALKTCLYYLFEKIGLDKVELDTAFFNNRAQKCFAKCGFRKTGEVTDIDLMKGDLIHKVLMEITQEEFFSRLYLSFNTIPVYKDK